MKLKPCPFCGGENLFVQDNEDGEVGYKPSAWWVQCEEIGCECEGPYRKNTEDAKKAWNERKGEP